MFIVKTRNFATTMMGEKLFRTKHAALLYVAGLKGLKLEPVSLTLPDGTVLPKLKLLELAAVWGRQPHAER